MKNSLIFISVIGLMLTAVLSWQKSGGDPDSCQGRCMSNESCMRMLDAEGITPYGSTREDSGLCNGICSTLRSQAKQFKQHAKQFGLPEGEMDYSNACMPVK